MTTSGGAWRGVVVMVVVVAENLKENLFCSVNVILMMRMTMITVTG